MGSCVASLTMVLVFCAVTPLQSGIFTVASTTISHNVSVSSPARLLPPSLQAGVLDANLPNTAYGVTWLGQAPPPFTTRQFALAPFSWHGLELAGIKYFLSGEYNSLPRQPNLLHSCFCGVCQASWHSHG